MKKKKHDDAPPTDTLSDVQRKFFVEAFRETISREKERVPIQKNYVLTKIDENDARLCLRDPGRTTWRSRRFATHQQHELDQNPPRVSLRGSLPPRETTIATAEEARSSCARRGGEPANADAVPCNTKETILDKTERVFPMRKPLEVLGMCL